MAEEFPEVDTYVDFTPQFTNWRHHDHPQAVEVRTERSPRSKGTMKYLAPLGVTTVKKAASLSQGARERGLSWEACSGHGTSMEIYREKGRQRWPHAALDQMKKQPTQFTKSEEVVPLQRMRENPQPNISAELWSRSLRTGGLHVCKVGMHNQNVATSTVSVLFDHGGFGWSGKTNTKGMKRTKPGEYGPHTKDWVERHVAVGKYHLDHMGGSRYAMDLTPRPCIPNSMAHATKG